MTTEGGDGIGELVARLRGIKARGPFAVTGRASGRFGLALERELGIPQNSRKSPDFQGVEIKTKELAHASSLQTLFSKVPTRYHHPDGREGIFELHSYQDTRRGRQALYTSFSINPDSLGFSLGISGGLVGVFRHSEPVLDYDAMVLGESLTSKHPETAFISVESVDGGRACNLRSLMHCRRPSLSKFLGLIGSGEVFLDLTMSRRAGGPVRDHGFLWRIRSDALPELYEETREIQL